MKAEIRERDVERYLIKQVKLFAGEVRKVKWIGRAGAPDRRVMTPSGCVWVELKRPGKFATSAQSREHIRMRRLREHVTVVASLQGVDDLLHDIWVGNYLFRKHYD